MEEAIKELENEQKPEEQRDDVTPVQETQDERAAEKPKEAIPLVLRSEYKNADFCVREYEPQGGRDGMVRIWSGTRPNFIYANVNRVPFLIDLLKNVMAGGELKPGPDEKDEIIRQKDAQIKTLQRELLETMDLLQAEREGDDAVLLREQITAMQKKIEMEERLNQRLKDKIVEMVLDF